MEYVKAQQLLRAERLRIEGLISEVEEARQPN